jgi:hypothetical protein
MYGDEPGTRMSGALGEGSAEHGRAASLYARLGQRSGGLCYWPGCPERLTIDVDDSRFVLQIAHIHAAEPGGARYDTAMTNDDRRDLRNLILLCYPHHVIADDKARARTYTEAVLHRWKAQREADPREAMKRLREVTPAALTQAVAAGVERHDARVLALLPVPRTTEVPR